MSVFSINLTTLQSGGATAAMMLSFEQLYSRIGKQCQHGMGSGGGSAKTTRACTNRLGKRCCKQ
eukprot:5073224-Prorocentrum_lima.AAC.1